MIIQILRALFILLMAAVGWYFVAGPSQLPQGMQEPFAPIFGNDTWVTLAITLVIGVAVVCFDILAPRRKLAVLSGTFFGLLVGLLVAYALSFLVPLIVDQFHSQQDQQRLSIIRYVDLVTGLVSIYLAISFVLQSKDDFRFIIPYVEFKKQTKGERPVLLDTSVLIDGRIADIAETGVLESRLIVPKFVLDELQGIADSGDKLKRNRGRRGLDVLQRLQNNRRTEVILYDSSARDVTSKDDVDGKLMVLAMELSARVLTNDFNLNKIAGLRGVDVINVNDLANALKPVVLPGEKMTVRILKAGESPGQGVGYLEDGTMVVVEQGRSHMNQEVELTVTSALQTSAGKMIFGRAEKEPANVPSSEGRHSSVEKSQSQAARG